MISLTYSCTCGWRSPVLDTAQTHADEYAAIESHQVRVTGVITARKQAMNGVVIEKSAETKAREAMIMRIARDRGLLK